MDDRNPFDVLYVQRVGAKGSYIMKIELGVDCDVPHDWTDVFVKTKEGVRRFKTAAKVVNYVWKHLAEHTTFTSFEVQWWEAEAEDDVAGTVPYDLDDAAGKAHMTRRLAAAIAATETKRASWEETCNDGYNAYDDAY